MSISSYQFIDPRYLAAVSDLQILAKTVVDGFMIGRHQSPRAGAGLEFSQYRSYQPGDDLRRVDWKMYARSDRYYVRESEIETSITIRFVVDASQSMDHSEGGVTKFDYARYLAASLGYLADSQGDAIGLLMVNDSRFTQVAPRRDPQHLHRFLHAIENSKSSGRWPSWEAIDSTFDNGAQRRDLVIFITDLHDKQNEISTALAKLSALKNEVLVLHLLGPNELDFQYRGRMTFEDLETGEKIDVDAAKVRNHVSGKAAQWVQGLRKTLHDLRIDYALFSIDQPLDFAIRKYLYRRGKMS